MIEERLLGQLPPPPDEATQTLHEVRLHRRRLADEMATQARAALAPLAITAALFAVDGPVDLLLSVVPVGKLGKAYHQGKKALQARKARKLTDRAARAFVGELDGASQHLLRLAQHLGRVEIQALKRVHLHTGSQAVVSALLDKHVRQSADVRWIAARSRSQNRSERRRCKEREDPGTAAYWSYVRIPGGTRDAADAPRSRFWDRLQARRRQGEPGVRAALHLRCGPGGGHHGLPRGHLVEDAAGRDRGQARGRRRAGRAGQQGHGPAGRAGGRGPGARARVRPQVPEARRPVVLGLAGVVVHGREPGPGGHGSRGARCCLARSRTYGVLAAVGGFICDKAWPGAEQSLFTPDEAQVLARAVADLERRARNVTTLLQRIARHNGEREVSETYRRVYDAFQEALGAATAQGAGFLWAAFWPDAEAELAERRAREEQFAREQAEAEEAFRRLSPEEREAVLAQEREEQARAHAELEALIEERLLKRLDSERAEYEDLGHMWLYLFPVEHVDALRAQLDASRAAPGLTEAKRLFERMRAQLAARAHEVVVLRKHGECQALAALDRRLCADYPEVHEASGIYPPARARALLDALGQWEAGGGGEDGVVAYLVEETWMPAPLVTAAYRACKRALREAGMRPCALFWLLNDPYELFDAAQLA